jgi:hypothetical protein
VAAFLVFSSGDGGGAACALRYFVLVQGELQYFKDRDVYHQGGAEKGRISLAGASCTTQAPVGGRYILGLYDPGKER